MKQICQIAKTLVFPNQCLGCSEIIDEKAFTCYNCFLTIEQIAGNFCKKCGEPLEFEFENELHCAKCLKNRPIFNKSRACFHYLGKMRDIIHKFKYEDQLHIAPKIAQQMQLRYQEMLDEADYIVPVPMFWFKLVKRNYNQSAILAKLLSNPEQFQTDILVKVKDTKPQFSLKYDLRMKNLKDSLAIGQNWVGKIKGKKILLIDDVMTTGATANACSKILLENGCQFVNVCVIAKTPNLL